MGRASPPHPNLPRGTRGWSLRPGALKEDAYGPSGVSVARGGGGWTINVCQYLNGTPAHPTPHTSLCCEGCAPGASVVAALGPEGTLGWDMRIVLYSVNEETDDHRGRDLPRVAASCGTEGQGPGLLPYHWGCPLQYTTRHGRGGAGSPHPPPLTPNPRGALVGCTLLADLRLLDTPATSESERAQGPPSPILSSDGNCGNRDTRGELSALSIRPLHSVWSPVLQYHSWAKGGRQPPQPLLPAQSPSLPPAGRTNRTGSFSSRTC